MAVCHVLRYFPPVLKIREIIDQGLIGEVVTIDHRENILWWHFAHSFVRGNWRNVATSTFSLLAKVQSMSLKKVFGALLPLFTCGYFMKSHTLCLFLSCKGVKKYRLQGPPFRFALPRESFFSKN